MEPLFLSKSLRYQLFFSSKKDVHYPAHEWSCFDHLIVFYNLKTIETVETEDGTHPVPLGEVGVLPAGTRFRLQPMAGATRSGIHCHFAILDWSDVLSLYRVPLFPKGEAIHQTLRQQINDSADCFWKMKEQGDSIPQIAKRDRIGFTLLETILSFSRERENSDRMFSGMQRLRPALRYIEENARHNLPLSEMAKRVNISESHFNKLFRQTLNRSPRAYLRSQILQRSLYLLAENRLSITQIADHFGYADPFQFSKQFKKHFGLSPRSYKGTLIYGE